MGSIQSRRLADVIRMVEMKILALYESTIPTQKMVLMRHVWNTCIYWFVRAYLLLPGYNVTFAYLVGYSSHKKNHCRNRVFMKADAHRTRLKMSSNHNSCEKKKLIRLYPYQEARKIARQYGFGTRDEFIEYECAGAYQLPKNPEEVWEEDWTGWDDFLGVTLSFEEALPVSRALGFQTEEEYLACFAKRAIEIDDESLASRLPYKPNLFYKTEWKGWDHYLGNEN